MAQAIVLPKLGNTVESAVILTWHVAVGAAVKVGDLLCEIETDKATLDVESSADGILLAQLCRAGDEAPVLSNIAVVGQAGESIAEFLPLGAAPADEVAPDREAGASRAVVAVSGRESRRPVFMSPRACALARRKGLNIEGIQGSGPDGRIIERDIEAAISAQVKLTPVAQAMLDSGEFALADQPPRARRLGKRDLVPIERDDAVQEIPLKGARKVIAARLLESLRTTAQFTLNASADARALLAFRRRCKESAELRAMRNVSINDLLLFAVARTLPNFPELNALIENNTVYQYRAVHLAMAVDSERGLLAPVIRAADALSLPGIAAEAQRLAEACRAGLARPDELAGGTFTVSNLGALGIESFTPVLNPPQVAILGLGSINLKPVQIRDEISFRPHIGLSLTVDHQVVDGAPAARFLQRLSANLAQIDALAE